MHDLQALWNLPGAPSDAFGQQQSLVRQVNDRIAEVAGELGADEVDFLCECSAPGCLECVSLTVAEYAAIRALGPTLAMAHFTGSSTQ
jgi:hypothetical protein